MKYRPEYVSKLLTNLKKERIRMTDKITVNGLEVVSIDAFDIVDDEVYVDGGMEDGQLMSISIKLKAFIKLAEDNGLVKIYPVDEEEFEE